MVEHDRGGGFLDSSSFGPSDELISFPWAATARDTAQLAALTPLFATQEPAAGDIGALVMVGSKRSASEHLAEQPDPKRSRT